MIQSWLPTRARESNTRRRRTFAGFGVVTVRQLTRQFRVVRRFSLQLQRAYFLGEFYFYDFECCPPRATLAHTFHVLLVRVMPLFSLPLFLILLNGNCAW